MLSIPRYAILQCDYFSSQIIVPIYISNAIVWYCYICMSLHWATGF